MRASPVALKRTQLEERYELRQILGEGGMGVVYSALDRLMQREVALKTILDIDAETMAMFYNEWNLLANMVHPNVISIYDIGEFEHEGTKKPFFVMPLLPGVTLDRLIRDGSPKLSVNGVVAIIEQACRGLHAAHQQGLVHRDVKPSNIFVMDDNSVKVIDFGIARTVSGTDTSSLRGTYPYMAPEQFARKPPTPLSDLFSLGIVTYQALTRRRPFQGTEDETVEAIQRYNPPSVSGLNRDVNYAISMVVAKALAKQPRHRFLNMLEFAEALQKALRNEPLEWFDRSKVKSRLERATRSFEQGDYVFASEVLSELEGEGHLDQEITLLRGQVDGAVRQSRMRQLLESARRFFEATEYALALMKIQEAMELDPNDPDTILLQAQVEKKRRESKISEWIGLARQHLDNQAFRQAREALENLLQLRPNDTAALGLLAEVGRQEQQLARVREDKARVYQSAKQAWEKGDVTSALGRLDVLIGMDRDNPETDTGRSATYQNFYNLVHSEHDALRNAYEEARRNLEADNFEAALAVSKLYLSKYPNHALFQALLFDLENRQRQKLSAAIAETDRRVQAERDLDRRMGILMEALKLYPNEPHFEGALRSVRDKRDLVTSIVAKACYFEERGQFTEALDQWQILKSIHSEQPELAFEIPRLIKRRDQQARETSRARLLEQVNKYLEDGDYDRAMLTAQNALVEFPEEAGFLELQTLVSENQERGRKALELLARAQQTAEDGSLDQSIDLLREANRIDPRSTIVRTVLVNSLLDRGRRVVDSDCCAAEELLREVLQVEPNCVSADSLASRIADRKPKPAEAGESAPPGPESADAAGVRLRTARTIPTPPAAGSPPPPPTKRPAAVPLPSPPVRRPAAAPTLELPIPSASPAFPDPSADAETADAAALTEAVSPPPVSRAPKLWPPSAASLRKALSRLLEANPGVWPPSPAVLRMILYGLIGAAAVLIVMSVITLATRLSRPSVRPAAARYAVTLSSSLGAQIKLDGKLCGTSLCNDYPVAVGHHRAEAQLAGYQPAVTEFDVTAEKHSTAIDLTLVPAPHLVMISTDLPDGSVMVDGAPSGQIQDGGAVIPSLALGNHEVTVQSGDLRASFTLVVAAGALPKIFSPIQAKGMRVFVIVESGTAAIWYGSETNIKISLDGSPVGDLVSEGLEMKGLAAGPHELVFTEPAGQQDKMAFESKPSTAVYVRMSVSRRGKQ
jgi:serine/threonine-protein kinase